MAATSFNSGTQRAKACAIVVLCVAVVLLSVSAKLSLYESSGPQSSVFSHGTRLLIADQKMEVRSTPVFAPLLWLATLLLPFVVITTRRDVAAVDTPVARTLSGFAGERFVRPPPSL